MTSVEGSESLWIGLSALELATSTFAILCQFLLGSVIFHVKSMHTNYKCLLLLSVLADSLVMANQMSLNTWQLQSGKIFQQNIEDYPEVPFFLFIHDSAYSLCSLAQLMVICERFIACRLLSSGVEGIQTRPFLLVVVCCACTVLATANSYFIHFMGYLKAGVLIMNTFDALPLALVIPCYRYSKEKYKVSYARTTLNARFELSEAVEVTRAILPVTVVNLVMKFLTLGVIAWPFIILGLNFECIRCIFYIACCVNAVMNAVLLISRHRMMHRLSLSWIHSLFGRGNAVGIFDDDARAKKRQRDTDQYFDLLARSWRA